MRLTLPAALPRVMAVPVLLQQVFVNLVANACDAYETIDADEADREIAIRAASDSGRVIVHVTDHAGGIPPDVLPRIFEPFFTTKQRRGTGMGLAVTDGIIRQIGGTIAACNQDGGATFEIGLPTEGGENPAATDVLAIARMAGR
jgi:C4-dicarboxylate-specific signal transduction histidine kinase